jgi:hypothetical protein
MTISVYPPRRMSEDVPPGAWDGTKQDAVLATAQLRDIWERKKRGEKSKFGHSEYDAQMANAQLRAYKLTKAVLRTARKRSVVDGTTKIESMGFKTGGGRMPRIARPPPMGPLPMPPPMANRPQSRASQIEPSPMSVARAPPTIPRKATARLSQGPPPVTIPQRKSSMDRTSRNRTPSPLRFTRADSPTPKPRKSPVYVPSTPDALPVEPFRRRSSRGSIPESPRDRIPPSPQPGIPARSQLRTHTTEPLVPKRRELQRSLSFRFGEGLHNRIGGTLYSELSDVLNELQSFLGPVEVH